MRVVYFFEMGCSFAFSSLRCGRNHILEIYAHTLFTHGPHSTRAVYAEFSRPNKIVKNRSEMLFVRGDSVILINPDSRE